MAEEEKKTQEEVKRARGEAVKKALKIILGIVLVAIGIGGICLWWKDLLTVIKGCIGTFFILAGLVCFLIAAE